MDVQLNKLTKSLGELCRTQIFNEKWLLAPSLRVGYQWLDIITHAGFPVLNVRVKTINGLAVELASSEMTERGLSYLRSLEFEVLIHDIFRRLKAKELKYLNTLEQSPASATRPASAVRTAMIQTLCRSLRDLRLAGYVSGNLDTSCFEVEDKGRDITAIMREYEKALKKGALVDYVDVLNMASARLKNIPNNFREGALVLLPQDMERDFHVLERALWNAIPEENRIILETDRPDDKTDENPTDARLLRFILNSSKAGQPGMDGTARIFSAEGEINEVREVFRRCKEDNIPFDEVEILHTDKDTYVPLIFEQANLLKTNDEDEIPATFSEGVPTRYSRPARTLIGLISWIREDYPQATLAYMVQDGLFKIKGENYHNYSRLAVILKSLPIGAGRDAYLPTIDNYIKVDEKKLKRLKSDGLDKIGAKSREKSINEHLDGLKTLRFVANELFECIPPDFGDSKAFLAGIRSFLDNYVVSSSRFDEYSLHRFRRALDELDRCMQNPSRIEGLDFLDWLEDLSQSTTVEGLGPRPGAVFVTPLQSGGHSGRKHTFIIGMDDNRFPGAGQQDPIVLDNERSRLTPEMLTASDRQARKMEDFAHLLSRLRSTVTLSYCSRELTEGAEMFPSFVLLSAMRILSGDNEARARGFRPGLATFTPDKEEKCLDQSEWWLWRSCGDKPIHEPEKLLADIFPNLKHGFMARDARMSENFTEYDGYVPEAGKDMDPTGENARALSASRLECLGNCPMEYFFRYVLEIEPPEEYTMDPYTWLDPMEKGDLLHEVFRKFMSELQKKGLKPDFKEHLGLMQKILADEVTSWETKKPAPNMDVSGRAKKELARISEIFLMEEEKFCKTSLPRHFEASIGLKIQGKASPLDTPDPVRIKLPNGKALLAHGKLDRVDEVPGSEGKEFTIWDYKTGSAWGYELKDPFRKGRRVQSIMYSALAKSRLEEVHEGSSVAGFGYFFPGIKEHGERIHWTDEQLAEGGQILEHLCTMLANGCFPFTKDKDDLKYSDYKDAFGDIKKSIEEIERKYNNENNKILEPYQSLRGKKKSGGKSG